jgi:hypothetical protein
MVLVLQGGKDGGLGEYFITSVLLSKNVTIFLPIILFIDKNIIIYFYCNI